MLVPASISPKLHVSVPLWMAQRAWPDPPSTAQDVPGVCGRASVTTTSLAMPGPGLVAVIVKPIGSPAETLAASAVLTTWMGAQLTAIVAVAQVFAVAPAGCCNRKGWSNVGGVGEG